MITQRPGWWAALTVSLGALVGCTWQEPINTDPPYSPHSHPDSGQAGGGGSGGSGQDTTKDTGSLTESAVLGVGDEKLRDLAAGDLDGDGSQDLILLSVHESDTSPSATLLTVLNDGKGGFRKVVAYKTGDVPLLGRRLALADLDDDGRLDVVVLGSNEGGFAVFRGDGQGGLTPRGTITGGLDTVHDVWTIDYDYDGDADVLSAGNNDLTLLRNDGQGNLTAETLIEGWGSAFCVFGKTNKDALNDAVAVRIDGGIRPYGRKDGADFSEPAPAPSLDGPVVLVSGGDLNGDGFVDLVSFSERTTSAEVALGNSAGTFDKPASQPLWTSYPRLIHSALADVNSDGHNDLITASANGLQLWPGKGDGTFGASSQLSLQTKIERVLVVDLNNDGKVDLVTFGARDGNNAIVALSARR